MLHVPELRQQHRLRLVPASASTLPTQPRVDEEGTEAAAATGVSIGPSSAPPTIVADRPFLFFIRDRPTGLVLFAGRVADPSVTD